MITLQYPETLKSTEEAGQHYLLIDSYESRNAITAGSKISSIALYIPPNSLQYSHGANYEGLDKGALFAAGGEQARKLFENNGVGTTSNIIAAALGGGGAANARALGITTAVNAASKIPGLGGNAPAALSAAAGLAVNNHMALVYRGPNSFRSHTFNFSFFPKNETESKEIQKIIEDLKNGMLPRYTGAGQSNGRLSSPFFKMPRHYKLNLFSSLRENTYLNDEMFPRNKKGDKINHVITNMTVNHDPNGVVSFHTNGAPVQTNLSISFQETEFVTSRDTVDDRFESSITQNFARQAQAQEQADGFAPQNAAQALERVRQGRGF